MSNFRHNIALDFSTLLTVLVIALLACSCSKVTTLQSNDLDTLIHVSINKSLSDRMGYLESNIVQKWEQYLNTRDTFFYRDSPLWSYEEKLVHKLPDFEIHSLCYRTKKFSEYKPSIISIQRIDSAYVLKMMFAKSDSGKTDLLAIYNVVAAKENNEFVFHRYSEFFGRQWIRKEVGIITIFYDSTHVFNEELAKKNDSFNRAIAKHFGVDPIPLRYYLFKSTIDRLRSKGYDFDTRMFETVQKSAEVDLYNNIIYASNGTEFYPHEVIHFYTNVKYGNSIHGFFNEGVATLLGGNINTYANDLDVLKDFTLKNPNFDFTHLTQISKSIGSTNTRYTVGALLCEAIINKGGWKSLDEVLKSGNRDQDLYSSLENALHIKQSDINTYVRDLILNSK